MEMHIGVKSMLERQDLMLMEKYVKRSYQVLYEFIFKLKIIIHLTTN